MLKKKLKQGLLSLLVSCRGHKLFKPFFSGIGHILMFHRVCPKSGKPRIFYNTQLEVTPGYLENAVVFFKERGYEFISLDRMYRLFLENTFKKKFVVVTFDDGYSNTLTHALPVLKKHDVPFTVYVSTNFPDGKAVLWWDLLEDLLLERDIIEIEIGSKYHRFDCASMKEKEDTFEAIRSIIIGFSERDFLPGVEKIFKGLEVDIYSKAVELALSWEEVTELARQPGVTIGAHTVNHYALKELPEERAVYEVTESKKKIEAHIGKEVRHFAYPFGRMGHMGAKDLDIIKKYGFKTAVTTIPGNIFPGHRDHLVYLPRVHMREEIDQLQLELFTSGLKQFQLHKFQRVVTL
jgi:peptidoglycan/xylan/chitin deacetylase (PgdA/CDA1 family)